MLNIRRVDHAASHTHCCRVTVQRRKRVFVRDFSDGRHASQQLALQAAQLYRDKLVKAYPPLSKAAYCAIRKKNNRSGISGLTRVDTWQMYRGRRFRRLYWEAQWPIGNGKAQHKKFSIPKYGEEGAHRRARTARNTALKALSTHTFSPFETRTRRRDQAG
ncbi:MAG: AP2 domain-containing protein [Nitrospiraceae bacterium]|nr:AP2 domain-containing protein [Nitrospiraceae bacterium]